MKYCKKEVNGTLRDLNNRLSNINVTIEEYTDRKNQIIKMIKLLEAKK